MFSPILIVPDGVRFRLLFLAFFDSAWSNLVIFSRNSLFLFKSANVSENV